MGGSEERGGSWLSAARGYLKPACIRMLFLGFSSGLPLLLVLGTLGFRLREAQVGLATIGFMSWIGLVYAFKWAWAPIVDRAPLLLLTRLLGRRRAWLALSQAGIMGGLAGMALTDPAQNLEALIFWALFTAAASATQDIALDAYRIESAASEEQGMLAAAYQFGYRIAMIWAGAGALGIAAAASGAAGAGYDAAAWRIAYLAMAASGFVGLAAMLCSPEPAAGSRDQSCARESSGVLGRAKAMFWQPLADFCERYGKWAAALLALVAVYRISDVVMGIMANPFYADMGFTKAEVALVIKVFGVAMTLLGTFLGGLVVLRIGVLKALFLGAILSSATNLLFAGLAQVGHSVPFLVFTVSADNLAGGLASAAFVAFLSGLTSREFSATQYALLSSVMLLLPKAIAGFSGVAVEAAGYSAFFIGTALIGIPAILLIALIGRSPFAGAAKRSGVSPES